MSRTALRGISHALIGVAVFLLFTATASAAPNKPGGTTSGSKPMSGETTYYSDRWPGSDDCFAKDDDMNWRATGSLKPGESYTYTPERPICADPQELPHVSADLTWSGSQLELTSTIPMGDFLNGDDAYNSGDTQGRQVVAPNVGNRAQLCIFMDPSAAGVTTHTPYSFTIRNVGTTTADGITLKGESHNGWPHYWNPDCYNGDADRDGWNDAFEETTAVLTYYSTGASSPYTSLIGSRYARADVHTTARDDEVDAYPPDVNDDGVVDQADSDRVASHTGEGTGVAINRISSNMNDPGYMYDQKGVWRRYDLNGDGRVDGADVAMVTKLVGQPYPAPDLFAPTVIPRPESTTASPGGYVWIPIDIIDNGLLRSAELQQDGRKVGNVVPAGRDTGYYWQAPKSRRDYTLAAVATDSAGNTTTRTFTIAVK